MRYSTTADPSDSYSNHWSNAPEEICPHCESKNFEYSHYSFNEGRHYNICLNCENEFRVND